MQHYLFVDMWNSITFAYTKTKNNMKTQIQITTDIKAIAKAKAMQMPIGTFSRLKIGNEISDIVISPSSSGIYFYNVPGTITEKILDQLICFNYYTAIN